MEIKNALAGVLTDCEVLEFLSSNKLREYPRLDDHIETCNKLLMKIDESSRKKQNDAYIQKSELDQLRQLDEVIWTRDKVIEHLQSTPAMNQKSSDVKALLKEIAEWESEFEFDAPLSTKMNLDGLEIEEVRDSAKELGVRLGRIVMVNGKEVKYARDLHAEVKKSLSENKSYKIKIKSNLSELELINLINTQPKSAALLQPLISDIENRLTEENENTILEALSKLNS
mmetsp:Transcript_2336/g.3321  ORF Transcript_2336/g.3321 Transcript_2336/m.3321 type:complete len:228 (-) Transcript_2336:39-722(-)